MTNEDAPWLLFQQVRGRFCCVTSGGCGIRTHEELAPLPVFKTSAIGH